MRGLSFGTRAASQPAGGGSPTIFTLVLDDLLTRFAEDTTQPASIRFKLTATAGTTDWIYLDTSNGAGSANGAIKTAATLGEKVSELLSLLTGYEEMVVVSAESTEAGDKYTYTITFDGSLGAVTLEFHASSQFYPTITLTEAVTQQGVAPVQETVRIDYDGVSDSGETILDIGGSITVASGLVVSYTPPSGWSQSAGGDLTDAFVCFSKDDAGATTDPTISSGPGVLTTPTQGVTGQLEIHTITPTPVPPTGGSWKPHAIDSAISYDDAPTVGNGDGWDTANLTSGTTLAAGAVGFTNGVNNDIDDTSLSPVNVDLTAPEITHSIS